MDVRLINPVLETMINVLSTMADVRPDVGKPCLKNDEIALGEVTGIMRMVSPQVRASLAITFTKPVIIDIVRRMLGEDIQDINDTARDLTGEMANMVVGGAKNLFAKQGYEFDMSTPAILVGKDHTVHHEFSGRTILLPFSAQAGQFFVEICFEDA
jgi:chemotaxis protein CheX